MQASTVSPQPPVPAAPSAPQVASPAPSTTFSVPQTAEEVSALRARRSEMSSQLSNVEGRRERLVEELRSAPAEGRQGIQDRIQQLDQRILQIEADLQETGRLLTLAPVSARGTTVVPPDVAARFPGSASVRDLTGLAAMLAMLVLATAFARRMWRRSTAIPVPPRESRESQERMERLEQAVDAIALEIERVGEAQRYQARILAEAQLMPALGMGQRAAEPIRLPEREPVRSPTPER